MSEMYGGWVFCTSNFTITTNWWWREREREKYIMVESSTHIIQFMEKVHCNVVIGNNNCFGINAICANIYSAFRRPSVRYTVVLFDNKYYFIESILTWKINKIQNSFCCHAKPWTFLLFDISMFYNQFNFMSEPMCWLHTNTNGKVSHCYA